MPTGLKGCAGPVLKKGLTFKPKLAMIHGTDTLYRDGARVFLDGAEVFSVNETGRRLLEMADGSVTLEEMASRLKLDEAAADVGMFFLALGRSGYLENRVEIMLYETRK